MVGYAEVLVRFHFLRNLMSRLILVRSDQKALMQDIHQIELGILELDTLAFQLVTEMLLLLLDVLGTVGNLLQNDLHHVHLTDGEAPHLGECLFLHVLVAR